ncbi:hypothetical protein J27TS7_16060 [Paenibacillus dendritiformis]|uniref:hypothetical protein n=1 Tax=Paenibacillus dendritiformis TaxID=130049 RepID=UPI001B029DB0|nr:hypothetical protein [Paenibacillus dendritiformis]GIO72092.1 hypothetical protein J27TS7_16060 [Paenibacillus dendritiformis]
MNKFSILESALDLNLQEHTLRQILTNVDLQMMVVIGKSTLDKINGARTVWDIRKAMRGFNKVLNRFRYSA